MKWKIAPRGLKEAQNLNFQPLMIKIHYIDGTRVMPQSFVQIYPNQNEMENSAKKRQED